MSLNDHLRYLGPDLSVAAVPNEYSCPECGIPVEIWSDERRGKCPDCGAFVNNKNRSSPNAGHHHPGRRKLITEKEIGVLIQLATRSGASGVAVIPSAEIVVENELAGLCGGAPRCGNYGLAPSCPPHVAGPSGFRNWQKKSEFSIVVKINIPTEVMFSDERREIMCLLHEIVAGVEKKASDMGFIGTKAFAGGSCKNLFCREHAACRRLSEQGECRNPQLARASMSGFGINVGKLMQSAGWPPQKTTHKRSSEQESMTWIAGLIVISDTEK